MVTELSCDTTRRTRHSILLAEILASIPKARKSLYRQLKGVHHSVFGSSMDARHEDSSSEVLIPAGRQSPSGPNGPGAGSLCFTHRACTRRGFLRVSCLIDATHIMKVSQSVGQTGYRQTCTTSKTWKGDSDGSMCPSRRMSCCCSRNVHDRNGRMARQHVRKDSMYISMDI